LTLHSVTMGTAGTITATGSAGDDNFGAAGAALGNFASTINGGAGADSITTGTAIDTVNGGAGDDVIDVGAGLGDSADGGAGDDTITIAADANLTSTDTYIGGDGTDVIAFGAAITDSAATFSAFSGFETLQLAPGGADAYTLSNFINNTSLTQLNFGDAGGNTITVTNAPASMTTVRVLAGAAGDTLSFDRLVDNTANSLTVDLRGGGITTLLTAADEETITISGNAATDDTVITTLTAGDLTTLNITGAADVTTTNNITSTILATVDASAATGAVDLDAGSSVVAITATGGSGGFTFEGGSGSDTITGGAGVDVILGNAGTDTINGGAGADDITGGNGADTLTGGTGLDAFFYGATTVAANGGDTITDFTASQGDEISIDIAVAGAAGGTADGIVKVDAAGEAAGSITNADLVVVEDGIVIDVSGANAADLAAINAATSDGGADELTADAEAIIIFNADTNGDGSADEIQAWYLHETGGTNSQADAASYIATFSSLAGTADLTDVFTATNVEFL
jgi:Ca2+-binding RTX toxin-like protein